MFKAPRTWFILEIIHYDTFSVCVHSVVGQFYDAINRMYVVHLSILVKT